MGKKGNYGFFERRRRVLSAVFVLICAAFILVSHHSWESGSALDIGMDIAGVALVLVGIAGRAWCTMYIGGRKNQELVTKGPYSMTRNPLYFFSFLAGLGICLEFENVYVIGLYVVFFPVYYHYVIKSEERRLGGMFGAAFQEYVAATPAFLPNVARYDAGSLTSYSPALVRKTVLDGSAIVLVLVAAMLIEWLHESGILHTFWTVP